MELSTKIPIPKSNHPIDYHSKIMAFGSCFAEHMGAKFQYFKFQSTTNPFGILFHPLAIEKVIHFALSEKSFTENDIFFLNERWHSFDAHSVLSHHDKNVFLQKLDDALKITRDQIKESTHFILTLGTAWVYKHKKSGELLANCHKVPQNEFEKQLLSVTEIEESLHKIVEIVKGINQNISFIFTISPVRHLKDGFVENQRSKANLITALQSFLNRKIADPRLLSGAKVADYFPSYEIMMDELRDYRFYAEDMVHPNQLAIDFIWERFSKVYFKDDTFGTMKEVDAIQKGLSHKPFNPNSESHSKFMKKLENQMEKLQMEFGHIRF